MLDCCRKDGSIGWDYDVSMYVTLYSDEITLVFLNRDFCDYLFRATISREYLKQKQSLVHFIKDLDLKLRIKSLYFKGNYADPSNREMEALRTILQSAYSER